MRDSDAEAFRQPTTVAAALARGVGYERLRRSDLDARVWGVRCAEPLDRLDAQARAVVERMREGVVVSHDTAALLHDLPLPPGRGSDAIHLTVGDGRAPHARGLRGHRAALGVDDVVLCYGLATTSIERTLVDLSATLDLPDLVAAVDAAVRRDGALRSRLIRRCRTTWRGVRKLRRAIELCDPESRSPQESRLRVRLVEAGLPVPGVNVAVRDRQGRFIGIADLYLPDHRIVIEYESEFHRTDSRQWRKDLRRFSRYTASGYLPLRATVADVVDPAALIRDIREIVAHASDPR